MVSNAPSKLSLPLSSVAASHSTATWMFIRLPRKCDSIASRQRRNQMTMKPEIRRSKSERSPKHSPEPARSSGSFLRISFGFRISDFGFLLSFVIPRARFQPPLQLRRAFSAKPGNFGELLDRRQADALDRTEF